MFFALINQPAVWSISSQKFFDLVESSIFYEFLNLPKFSFKFEQKNRKRVIWDEAPLVTSSDVKSRTENLAPLCICLVYWKLSIPVITS